jgi:DNA gyrase subunit B
MGNRQVQEYSADQIQVLEGLDPVRKRPSMYIGTTGPRGLHHLVYEVVDNSIDEALAGYCDVINVIINHDNSIEVNDNGRGIPVETHPQTDKSTLETVLTMLHAGGKFGGGGYKVSGGLHGVGVAVVNALSEYLEAVVKIDGKVYWQRYERGNPLSDIKLIGETKEKGTSIIFRPDTEIFEEVVFEYETLEYRLRELAFLNKGIRITLTDKRAEKEREETFHYNGGIREFIKYLNKNKKPIHNKIIYFSE